MRILVEKNHDGMTELILSISNEITFGTVNKAVTDDLSDGDLQLAWENYVINLSHQLHQDLPT